MRYRRRLTFIGMFALAILATACDPAPIPSDPGSAWLTVDIGADGTATATFYLPPEHQGRLRAATTEIGRALFPDGRWRVVIDGNDGGYDLGNVRVSRSYGPGPHPVVRLQAGAAVTRLQSYGIDHVHFFVDPPAVPTTVGWAGPGTCSGCHDLWLNASNAGAVATIRMLPASGVPEPHLIGSLLGLVLALLALATYSLPGSRDRLGGAAMWLGLSGAATAVATYAFGVAFHPDNLGVSGRLSGTLLLLAQMDFLWTLIALAAGVTIASMAGSRDKRARRRSLRHALAAHIPPRADVFGPRSPGP